MSRSLSEISAELEDVLKRENLGEKAQHVWDDMFALDVLVGKLAPGQLHDSDIQEVLGHLIEDIMETVDEVQRMPYMGRYAAEAVGELYVEFVETFEEELGGRTAITGKRLLEAIENTLG